MDNQKSLFDNFFDSAPDLPGFKYAYTAVYMAALKVSREQRRTTLIDAVPDIQERAKVGRTLLLESLKWLNDNNILSYKAVPNGKLPTTIKLHLESASRINSGLVADYHQISSGLVADSKPHAHTHEPARAELVVSSNLEKGGGGKGTEETQPAQPPHPTPQPDVPVFVQQHRAEAAAIAKELRDRHPPIDNQVAAIDDIWCTIQGTPHTKSGFQQWLEDFYRGERATTFAKNTGFTPQELISRFLDERANGTDFANKRQINNIFELFAKDCKSGKVVPREANTANNAGKIDMSAYFLNVNYEE
jgi:hypothetical protein